MCVCVGGGGGYSDILYIYIYVGSDNFGGFKSLNFKILGVLEI